jgi:hypothetical protein
MKRKIAERRSGILTYGITPPKKIQDPAKREDIAQKQLSRIRDLPVDGLVVYDIQDEAPRTAEERPFPYLETADPAEYAFTSLAALDLPKVVYRSTTRQSPTSLAEWFRVVQEHDALAVLVGAASSKEPCSMRLLDAYALRRASRFDVPLGGVLIAERHEKNLGEASRILGKQSEGCSFFVSQAVYSSVATKNVLSDIHYRCLDEQRHVPPILMTLSPCGSLKTLEFMRWLGISIPRWLENELTHARDILERSIKLCEDIFLDVHDLASTMGIPLGCNVESVSIRKEEIDASVYLTRNIARWLNR